MGSWASWPRQLLCCCTPAYPLALVSWPCTLMGLCIGSGGMPVIALLWQPPPRAGNSSKCLLYELSVCVYVAWCCAGTPSPADGSHLTCFYFLWLAWEFLSSVGAALMCEGNFVHKTDIIVFCNVAYIAIPCFQLQVNYNSLFWLASLGTVFSWDDIFTDKYSEWISLILLSRFSVEINDFRRLSDLIPIKSGGNKAFLGLLEAEVFGIVVLSLNKSSLKCIFHLVTFCISLKYWLILTLLCCLLCALSGWSTSSRFIHPSIVDFHRLRTLNNY